MVSPCACLHAPCVCPGGFVSLLGCRLCQPAPRTPPSSSSSPPNSVAPRAGVTTTLACAVTSSPAWSPSSYGDAPAASQSLHPLGRGCLSLRTALVGPCPSHTKKSCAQTLSLGTRTQPRDEIRGLRGNLGVSRQHPSFRSQVPQGGCFARPAQGHYEVKSIIHYQKNARNVKIM